MPKFRRMNVGNAGNCYADTIVIDRYSNTLVFASIVGYAASMSFIIKEINKSNNVYIDGIGYTRTAGCKYDIVKKKQSNSDFVHIVVNKKDDIKTENDNETLFGYIYYRNNDERLNAIYDKIYANTPVPVLIEWMPYIISELEREQSIKSTRVYYDNEDDKPQTFFCQSINITQASLSNIVSRGLQIRTLNVNGTNVASEDMIHITGLDNYLNTFAETLAEKIQESFVPKFTPGQDKYDQKLIDFDDNCFYNGGIDVYEAQLATMQSMVNNLNKNNVGLVIGEMGTGKTLMGAGITYAHHKKDHGLTAIVICPSHLTQKWKREVERLVPNGRGYVLHNLKDLLAINDIIRDKKRKENIYLIMSKEAAKFGYETRPCAVWSDSKHCFVCPECGQPLYQKIYLGSGRNRQTEMIRLGKRDMTKQYAYNKVCTNKIQKPDENGILKEVDCNTKLWVPLNGENNTGWIKLGSEGWIKQDHIDDLFEELSNNQNMTRKDSTFFEKLVEKKIELESGKVSIRAPRKYPLAKYIKKYYKNCIDYLLCDELHLLKGETAQGQAMADLASVSKYFLGLTGTLLNGYADGLFYILYRTLPQLMKKEGFEFSSESEFQKAFGVVKKSDRYAMINGRQSDRIGMGKEKRLPGVSPLVFTKFLLENSAFISLSDMSEGLPGYEEIPISVNMDTELRTAYTALEEELRRASSWNNRGGGGTKVLGSLLQTLSVYPDMPYDQPPVIHPDTGQTLVIPQELPRGLRNKENRLLELVQEKKANGEKVLVYYNWVNRTDIASKLTAMFAENNITSIVLDSKVKAEDREQWIESHSDGLDVLICNPALVETGLDLLDFTSIVFYQMGYNIFTMRQASRRSWRLSQTRDIKVYFIYYTGTIQEQALSLMATKLQASMAIEGKFSEEGLRAMSNNEDLLTQIASSVVQGISHTVNANVFKTAATVTNTGERITRDRRSKELFERLVYPKTDAIQMALQAYMNDTEVNKNYTTTQVVMNNLFKNKLSVVNLY